MLDVLQYLSLICAFFLPWLIVGTVKYAKARDKRKTAICVILIAVCAAVIALCVAVAFGIRKCG